MKINRLASLLALILYWLASGTLSAAVIASYTFDTISSNASPTSDLDLNSTATDIAAGVGVTMVSSGAGNPSPSGAMQGADSTNENNAVAGNNYFEFTITPSASFQIDLSTLSLQYQRNNTSGPTNLIVRSSLDSFTTNLFADGTIGTSSFETGNITLSALPAFQNLTSGVSFRIYAWGGGSTTSLRLDNIFLDGTVTAVPEPSAAALLGLLAPVLVLIRRRARKH